MSNSETLHKPKFPDEITKRIQNLYKKNNWRNLLSLVLDWGTITATITLSIHFDTWWMYLVSIILIGSRMRGLDNLMHEASHAMLFKNKFLNRWIGSIFVAVPVFTSYTSYCQSHYAHHRHLWNPEKDPDTKRYRLMGLDKPHKSFIEFIFKHILRPLTLFHVPRYIYGAIIVNLFSSEQSKVERITMLIFWIAIIGSSFLFGFWQELLLYWFVPMLTVFQIIRYWSEMAEHSGLNTNNALYASRNTFGNPIERFLLHPHSDNYHLVHHLFPYIPHYNLKKAHLILMESPEYKEAHHCIGFFRSFAPGFASVLEDIYGKYKRT